SAARDWILILTAQQLLCHAKRSNSRLQCVHAVEPQRRSRGVEPTILLDERRDTLEVAVRLPRRTRKLRRDFHNYHLAVPRPDIIDQDFIFARIERATTATWIMDPAAATMGGTGAATAAIASAPT